ncbi:MAG: hypothetical protein H6741_34405 [Alphaproteobacteria bacterium]|nr:hypothetical protein [Alphaproteobacteria bacterium]MCB9797800.1 hypothetical protein [Alphaproteobacteria bacterium]
MPESPLPPALQALRRVEASELRFAEMEGVPRLVRRLWKPILPLRRPPRAEASGGAPEPTPSPLSTAPLPGHLRPRFHANVLPVLGHSRALVCDLQRRRAHAILPALVQLIAEADGEPLSALRDRFGGRLDVQLDRLLRELLALDLIQLSPWPEAPELELDFAHPARITNAVLDYDADSTYDLRARFAELQALGCEHALLRVKGAGLAEALLERIAGQRPLALQLRVEGERPEAMQALLARWPRVLELVLHGHPPGREGRLLTLPEPLLFELPEQPVAEDMAVNIEQAAESLAHDPFSHRKAFITAQGQPSDGRRVFRDRPLIELIEDPDFTARWHVPRAQVAGCAGCARRRVCVDPGELVQEDGRWRRAAPCPLLC